MKEAEPEFEQLSFTGGAFDVIKKYSDRVRQYEKEKDKLKMMCVSCEEYEQKLKELAEQNRVDVVGIIGSIAVKNAALQGGTTVGDLFKF